jgi:hypothetical protein
MCPAASSEQPKTTPLVVVTGPDVPPKSGAAVCQSTFPLVASRPLHTPQLIVPPLGSVQDLKLEFAFAV